MPLTRKPEILVAILALALTLTPAIAQSTPPPIRDDDAARLDVLNESLGQALRQAFAGGEKGELAVLADALRGTALPVDEAQAALAGDWNCRVIKLGRSLPIVAYPEFRCRADGSAFEKLTGSQRTKGEVHEYDGQLIYLGTGFVAGEVPADYADLPPETDPQSTPQFIPEVGLVEMTSPRAGRIIFPRPHLESETDLLVLTR